VPPDTENVCFGGRPEVICRLSQRRDYPERTWCSEDYQADLVPSEVGRWPALGIRARYGNDPRIQYFETVALTDKASGKAGAI
jgi:hypothetical protein